MVVMSYWSCDVIAWFLFYHYFFIWIVIINMIIDYYWRSRG